jgi:hypothetical protein
LITRKITAVTNLKNIFQTVQLRLHGHKGLPHGLGHLKFMKFSQLLRAVDGKAQVPLDWLRRAEFRKNNWNLGRILTLTQPTAAVQTVYQRPSISKHGGATSLHLTATA